MLHMISWAQFFGVVAVLLILYYAYVGLVYYRSELLGLLEKGKPAQRLVTPVPASLLGNRGPLIPLASAVMLPLPKPSLETDLPESKEAESSSVSDDGDEIRTEVINDNNISVVNENEKNIKFTNVAGAIPVAQSGQEAEAIEEEFEQHLTVGVAQLSDYFERASAGEITQEQLVKQVPALKDTQVLEAFYQQSKKTAQQLTATLYSEVGEPVIG
jgi:hypothetical protein